MLARRPAGLQGGDLVEVGLVERPDQVHLLAVASHVLLQLLAPAPDREQVRREAAQPVCARVAEEAATDQPGQLLPHVLQRRQGGQLGPPAQHAVRVAPVGQDTQDVVQHRVGPRVQRLAAGRDALETRSRPVLSEVLRILADWRDVDRMLSGRAELATLPALQDMREQLARLVARGFLGEAGADRLRRFPTYLLAVRRRRERLADDVLRDRQLMDQVTGVQDAVLHQLTALPEGRPPGERLRRARWLLEEYRVSLFAQQLGTDGPVSDQRIRTLLTV